MLQRTKLQLTDNTFPSLAGQGPIVIDCETRDEELKARGPGYHRPNCYIAGVAVATEAGFRRYYPIAHETGENLDKTRVLSWLKRELGRSTQPKVFANALYDLGFLAVAGVTVAGKIWDVQVAEPLLDENQLNYSLEMIARRHGLEGKFDEEMDAWLVAHFGKRNPKGSIWRAPPEVVAPYAIGDVDLPLKIFARQRVELERQGLWNLFDLESRLLPMLLAMRMRGVRVDLARAEKLREKFIKQKRQVEAEVRRTVGVDVQIWAAKSIGAAFDALGLPYPLTPKTRAPSFTKSFLADHSHKVAQLIVEARRLDKMVGTFLEGSILEQHVGGRVYTQFHPMKSDDGGTVTGRFSSSGPNLQFIPVRTDDGKMIRQMFLPEEGQRWWKMDQCVSPETKILTTDLRYICAREVRVGDELIAFDENLPKRVKQALRSIKKTKVVCVKRLQAPCVRIVTDQGHSIVCSKLHRWLSTHNNRSSTYRWINAGDLRVGYFIQRLCDVWEFDESHESGWVSGFMDGEGSFAKSYLTVGQLEGPVLDRCRRWCGDHGFQWKERTLLNGVKVLHFTGGRQECWRFLGITRPTRLLSKVGSSISGTFRGRNNKCATVVSIEDVGVQEVIGIQTGEGTFIAEGLASHNSQVEFRLLVHDAVCLRLPTASSLADRFRVDPSTDFHEEVAAMAGLERGPAKTVNFGLAYGEGEEKLARQLGLDRDGARKLLNRYHARVPFMRPLSNALMSRASKVGEIETLLGRKRRFDKWEIRRWDKEERKFTSVIVPHQVRGSQRAFTYKALNARIQGSAADVMKKSMVDVWESGACDVVGPPHLTVHDELDGSYPETREGYEALVEIKRLQEECVKLRLPLKVDWSTGKNWGDLVDNSDVIPQANEDGNISGH